MPYKSGDLCGSGAMSSAIKSAGVLFGYCLIASAFASYEGQDRHSPINPIVTWTRCQDYDGFDCGIFDSPLDHADPKQGKALIAVIRFNATKERRGSIFINPGGLDYGSHHRTWAITQHGM